MNSSKYALLLTLGAILATASVRAQSGIDPTGNVYTNNTVYHTDFTGGTYSPANLTTTGNTVSQDGWYAGGSTGISGSDVNYAAISQVLSTSSNGLTLGGTDSPFPGVSSVGITADRYISLNGNNVFFASTFNVDPGTTPGPNGYDTFGWNIVSASGPWLVGVTLSPIVNGSDVQYQLGAFSWASDAPTNSDGSFVITPLNGINGSGGTAKLIDANQTVSLGFAVLNIGLTNQAVNLYSFNTTGSDLTNPQYLSTTYIQGTNFDPITVNAGINDVNSAWYLADPSGTVAGNNQLNQYAFSVANAVPEPSSWVLIGISGLVMVVAFRRKKA